MKMMKLREQASKKPVWMGYVCIGERVTSVIQQSGVQVMHFSPVQAASSILDLDDVKLFRI